MKERKTKVEGLIEKAGFAKDSEVSIQWPEALAEIPALLGKMQIGNLQIEITEERILQWAFRGFTLSFQGSGENLSEAEKADRKVHRKADNNQIASLRKSAKANGISLAELIMTLK